MTPDEVTRVSWFLTGATATGKTRYALALARELDAEIISMDSMAIYRGMDVGTAKPRRSQLAETPHHLIDVVDPEEEFSVAQYVEAAHRAVAEIQARGRPVLFVGGTPLYLKALLRGIFQGPPANWELRREIEREATAIGGDALFRRLEQIDPVAASNIHPNDTRRLIRALEVFRATGQPISHQQLQFDDARSPEDCRVFVLQRSREEQHARINLRVERMIERGLLDEVRGLTSAGRTLGRTARQAVGYREALQHLAGELSREQMIDKIKSRTRQFAKRQATWFRSLRECRSFPIAGKVDPLVTAQRIVCSVEKNGSG
ncbi:MAG: tRNA (adenosine(37)-N6)-dimethylallyltransferase MiaA [Planctomycetota bacterium]